MAKYADPVDPTCGLSTGDAPHREGPEGDSADECSFVHFSPCSILELITHCYGPNAPHQRDATASEAPLLRLRCMRLLGHAADNEDSSDHLIRPGQYLVGDGEAKSPSGLEVDDEFKGCRLFHRYVGRLGAL